MSSDSSSFAPISRGPADIGALLGRVLLAAIFVWAGYGKLVGATATIAYFAKLGLPVPPLAYGITVLVELGGGLLILVGLLARPSALVLAVWCIATALVAHTDFADRNMQIHFMKNVAMAGGLLYAAILGPGRYSLDATFRGRRRDSLSTPA